MNLAWISVGAPTVPGLVERLGGLNPIAVASAMNVRSHLVDLSPLSTTGALCLAGVPAGVDPRGRFNKLLAWGLSMTVVGAVVRWLMFSRTNAFHLTATIFNLRFSL